MAKYIVNSIVVDTLNAIGDKILTEHQKKPGHDEWRDFGVSIYTFFVELRRLGFEIVIILGGFGTGKSYGMKTLTPGEFFWFNPDRKNVPWGNKSDAFKELYGSINHLKPFQIIPDTYQDIITVCSALKRGAKMGADEAVLGDTPIAFLLGHTEEYKGKNGEIKERLKIHGKMATKMNIEGATNNCLGAEINRKGSQSSYKLRTYGDGLDTIRSTEGLFDPLIDNDYEAIRKILVAEAN
jgi:hypothetical protein